MGNRTLPNMFQVSVHKYPDNIFLWEKTTEKYVGTTYAEVQKLVHRFGAGLIQSGVILGERIGLISEGRNYWLISELGILFSGAVNVPISIKLDELSDLKFRLSHSECRMVVVSATHLEKIRKIKKDLPDLKTTILLDDIPQKEDDEIFVGDLLRIGEEFLAKTPKEFTARWESIQDNDYANICYTSGTTADPKGIILTHRNYTANIEQCADLFRIPESYVSLIILPWDHAFAHTAGIYTLMRRGASIASVQQGKTPLETLKNIPQNIQEIKPTFLLTVPAIAKSFRKSIEKGINDKGILTKFLFRSGLKFAYWYNGNGFNKGAGKKKWLKLLYSFYDKIIFANVRNVFGGKLEFFIGGGALLDIELQKFFYAIGLPMYQGYGLTEASPVISANHPSKHKLGTSGWKAFSIQVRVCDSEGNTLEIGDTGEIVAKGENIMAGYWKNEEATKEVLKDGWLFTGDMGYRDPDGFYYILGRYKSLLIGSDGEKYAPEGIEEALIEHSVLIDQIMLYNNQSPYTVALVVLNKESLFELIKAHNFDKNSESDQRKILKLVEAEVNKFRLGGSMQGKFPERWLPAAIAILSEGFTEQNKLMNSTLKIVRNKIAEYHKDRIDFMFTSEGKEICNKQNIFILSRL